MAIKVPAVPCIRFVHPRERIQRDFGRALNSAHKSADTQIMRRIVLQFFFLALAAVSFSQTKPLYRLPDSAPERQESVPQPFLIAADSGLFRIWPNGTLEPLWTEGKVTRILRTEYARSEADGIPSQQVKWYIVTSKGILSTEDLRTFVDCNNGLPFLTIKDYVDGKKSLVRQVQLLKDICADPLDPSILVTATKDAVYLTRDGGASWSSIGSTSKNTAGLKSVAVAHMPVYAKDGSITGSELVVFMSHPIYGFSYCFPDAKKITWNDVSAGFDQIPTIKQTDEVSDILPVLCRGADGSFYAEIYCAQSFLPNIYRFNWKTKKAEKLYAGTEQADTIDSLCQVNDALYFTTMGKISAVSLEDGSVIPPTDEYFEWKSELSLLPDPVNAAFVPPTKNGLSRALELSELWMLNASRSLSAYDKQANGKKAVYISAYQVRNMTGIEKYKKIVQKNKLNAVVVDMKDDYGLLRFTPNNPMLKEKGYVTQYKIDVEQFVSEFKKDDVYLIGRIVVFKDKHLASYDKGQYAVWNKATGAPWVGTRGSEEIKDANGNVTGKKTLYYDENWVDPYSEEVWEYNVEIAKELIERGFDEIQFDYIRFPTDGLNMSSATYRWRDEGMDKESALASFLAYARKNIDAPIGIDIYGANGWYRSGTRTGQDVELMSEYVDVICPMFYPSHFEQNFLEYKPYEERPYRIYFYGTYRNTVIGRNRIIVRPWVQAFYMGVRYDKAYYDKNYVLREIFGVRDGANRGYMYWNNSGGNYDDISPDPADNELSPWHKNEAALQNRLPAFSTEQEDQEALEAYLNNEKLRLEAKNADMISILDAILQKDAEADLLLEQQGAFHNRNLLYVAPFTEGGL